MGNILGGIVGLVVIITLVLTFIIGGAYLVRDMVNAHEKHAAEGHPIKATLWLLLGLSVLGFFVWVLWRP